MSTEAVNRGRSEVLRRRLKKLKSRALIRSSASRKSTQADRTAARPALRAAAKSSCQTVAHTRAPAAAAEAGVERGFGLGKSRASEHHGCDTYKKN